MREFIFTYTNQSIMASSASICTKLKHAQRHYVQIPFSKFHRNRTINAKIRDKN